MDMTNFFAEVGPKRAVEDKKGPFGITACVLKTSLFGIEKMDGGYIQRWDLHYYKDRVF
jgi:hypothetical protein